jgi:hypothetical protein
MESTFFYIILKGEYGEEQTMHILGRKYTSLEGSKHTFQSYGCKFGDREGLLRNMPKSHLEFIQNLPLIIESSTYLFVHSGLSKDVSVSSQLKILYSKTFHYSDLEQITSNNLVEIPKKFCKCIVSCNYNIDSVFVSEKRILLDNNNDQISSIILPAEIILKSN